MVQAGGSAPACFILIRRRAMPCCVQPPVGSWSAAKMRLSLASMRWTCAKQCINNLIKAPHAGHADSRSAQPLGRKGHFMRYARPTTAAEAAGLLSQETGVTRILSGGTDVLVQLKAGMLEPDLIVDVKRIPGMADITPEAGGFRIGAAVPGAVLGEHAGVVALWPGVVEGCNLIGSTQVQGRATMAGNLCNASPAGDAVPGLVAADAVARIFGPDGQRDCPILDIPAGPGKTTLKKGEFVTSILLPARAARSGDAYLRFIPRTEMDIAVASAAVSVTLDGAGVVTAARMALGAVAPTVRLVQAAADAIIGTKLEASALAALSAAASAACSPIDDKRGTIEFRTQVAGVLARRAALIAYERAGGQA